MNLTSFGFDRPLPHTPMHPQPEPQKTPTPQSMPLILSKLGERIQEHALSKPSQKITPERIKAYEELNGELQTIYDQIGTLMQKSYQEESIAIAEEISLLEGKVKKFNEDVSQVAVGKDLKSILKITQELHVVLSSMEDWMAFQERYHKIDDVLGDALESTTSAFYSDLHGWSRSAAHGVMDSLSGLTTLIDISGPVLKQKGVFTSELLEQLASSVRSGAWGCADWMSGLLSNYKDVVSVAQNQWEQASREFASTRSVEAYTRMHLAGEQLLEMRQILNELIQFQFPDFSLAAKPFNKTMKGAQNADETYSLNKNIRNDLQLLGKTIDDLRTQLPKQLRDLENLIQKNKIEDSLNDVHLDHKDLNDHIQNVMDTYNSGERALDRYIAAKRQLAGLFVPEIKHFCHSEELFLTQEEGPVDFNELVLADMMHLGQPQPGIFSRIWQAIDPANWSESTKRWAHVSLLGVQLIDQVAKMVPKKDAVIEKPEPVLSEEDQQKVAREIAFLGTALTKSIEHLKDSKALDNLCKKTPEIKPVLAAVAEYYSSKPSKGEQRTIMDRYQAYRTEMLLKGASDKTPSWIVQTSAYQADRSPAEVKTGSTALPRIEGFGPFLVPSESLPEAKQAVVENLKEAASSVDTLDRQLRQCSMLDYLKPKRPMTPHALSPLRNELALFRHALSQTMEKKPAEDASVPEWADWNSGVQEQCFSLKELEGRIAEAMSSYEEAFVMLNIYNYNSLDVFGNKHKNLVKQAHIVEAIGLQGVHVPMPQGIASAQVMKFLNTYAPEIFERWEQIRLIASSGLDKILDNPEVIAHLKAVDEGIEKAFQKAAADKEAFADLGFSAEMTEWLAELAKNNKFLMVRSTGAEDSKQSANAGGNASIAYVKPTQDEVCKALGEVVRSYFSTGSLQKRLNANLNPFEDELRVAVTTQELVGEPLGGATDPREIPVSMVLFTSEPLYIGDEKFRAMRLSATYGHGEGVVGNQGIASDTALILISASDPSKLYILYDNQEKPERLAPVRDEATGKIILQKIANSKEMAQKPALNNDMITRLYEWGVIGEKYFEDYPTDMEIVVKGDTIYPVQGRPINRPKLFATYLDMKKIVLADASPIDKTVKLEVVVPGIASVVEIEKPEEILIAQTLGDAEGLFVKGQHKLIIVGKPEPSNSHPVVNFSALGMPCLYADKANYAYLQELAKGINPSKHLAVCVQSGNVSAWDASKGKVSDFTSEGFVVHPAKIAISMPAKSSLPIREGVFAGYPKEVRNILDQLSSATNDEEAIVHLKSLQNHPWIKSLDGKIADLEDKVKHQPLFEKHTRPVIEAATVLKNRIEEAYSQVEAILEHPSASQRLELLIRIKVLDTLLFQSLRSGSIGQHSLLTIQESFAAAEALMLYQAQLAYPAHFADLLMDGSQGPVGETFEDWNRFLLELEPYAEKTLKGEGAALSLEDIFHFRASLHTLRKAEVLPLFMTFFFRPQTDPVETLRAITALMPSSEEPLIEEIFARKAEMRQLRNDIAQIGNPKDYQAMFTRLKKAVDALLPENQPWFNKDQWQAVSPITRSIALGAMNELVDIYDTAIKTMKASSEITSDIEKTQKFKEMLGPYMDLLTDWSRYIVTPDGYVTHADWPLLKYLMIFVSSLGGLPNNDPGQLRPSPEFSVSAAVLGARTAFERHFPQTLEDAFTLIHQNLLASTSLLTQGLFSADQIQNSQLPPILKGVLEKARLIAGSGVGAPQQIGMTVDKTGITIYFNVPLRNHSGKFSVRYDRESGKTSMEAQFLGQARERWYFGAMRAGMLNAAGILPINSEPKVTLQELIVEWDISTDEYLERAIAEYRQQAIISMSNFLQVERRFIDEFVSQAAVQGNVAGALRFILKESKKSDFTRSDLSRTIENGLTGQLYRMLQNAAWVSGQAVLEQGQELSPLDVISVVREIMNSGNLETQVNALGLVSKVVEFGQGQAVSEAISAAQDGMKRNDLQKYSLDLFLKIVELGHGQGVPEAISAAQEGMKSGGYREQDVSIDILLKVLELGQGRGISESLSIIDALSLSMERSDIPAQRRRNKLLSKVIEVGKGQGISEALSIVASLKNDNSARWIVEELLAKVVEFGQGQGIPEAIYAAQKGAEGRRPYKHSVFNLFSKLVEFGQGQGIPEAISAVQEELSIHKEWGVDLRPLWYLLSKVVEFGKGQGLNEALIAARAGVDKDGYFNYDSLKLWAKIVEFRPSQDISEEAIAIIKKYMKVNSYRMDEFRPLWIQLVKSPQSNAAAQQLVIQLQEEGNDQIAEVLKTWTNEIGM